MVINNKTLLLTAFDAVIQLLGGFMELRIISDIHCDVNERCNDSFDFGNDFVICCGDISGDRFTTEKWIKKNIKRGIIVAGNHLGYNFVSGADEDSLNSSIKYLQENFLKNRFGFWKTKLSKLKILYLLVVSCLRILICIIKLSMQ